MRSALQSINPRTAAESGGAHPFHLTVLAQGDYLIPIPGTKQRKYLEENVDALDVKLSRAEWPALEAFFPADATAGSRCPEEVMKLLDR